MKARNRLCAVVCVLILSIIITSVPTFASRSAPIEPLHDFTGSTPDVHPPTDSNNGVLNFEVLPTCLNEYERVLNFGVPLDVHGFDIPILDIHGFDIPIYELIEDSSESFAPATIKVPIGHINFRAGWTGSSSFYVTITNSSALAVATTIQANASVRGSSGSVSTIPFMRTVSILPGDSSTSTFQVNVGFIQQVIFLFVIAVPAGSVSDSMISGLLPR